jgi:hypothetical protein
MALKKHNVCAQWIPASMHVWLAGLTAVRVRSKEWSTTNSVAELGKTEKERKVSKTKAF